MRCGDNDNSLSISPALSGCINQFKASSSLREEGHAVREITSEIKHIAGDQLRTNGEEPSAETFIVALPAPRDMVHRELRELRQDIHTPIDDRVGKTKDAL
ncbi:hypothetical protein TN91_21875 [Rhodococcus ruber]|nr:hypothetical protein TN91_21875 [Rhodococcus ruber]